MLFRQHIPIPNYFHVGLGQCSGEVSSEKKRREWFLAKNGFLFLAQNFEEQKGSLFEKIKSESSVGCVCGRIR